MTTPNECWLGAETEEELTDLLDMFWGFHDFRVERIEYSAAEDRIDLFLENDTHQYRVVLRFEGGAYLNFWPGYYYPADWLQGASLGIGGRGRIVWAAYEGADLCNPSNHVLWVSGDTFSCAMLDEDGLPIAVPDNVVHQEYRGYDFELGKKVEYSKDFHPRYLCDEDGAN